MQPLPASPAWAQLLCHPSEQRQATTTPLHCPPLDLFQVDPCFGSSRGFWLAGLLSSLCGGGEGWWQVEPFGVLQSVG